MPLLSTAARRTYPLYTFQNTSRNFAISASVPMVTRSMLSSGGNGRPGATPSRGIAAMNSRAFRPQSTIMKFAFGSMNGTRRSRSHPHSSRRVFANVAFRSGRN